MEISQNYAVQLRGISKSFGGTKVLDNVDLNIRKGTVHAILGENGAGKSTLMNIIFGIYRADQGEIFLNGKPVDIKNSSIAIANGIGMVHQHFMLIDKFTVTQNIILGNENCNNFGVLNLSQANKTIKRFAEKYGFDIDVKAKVSKLSVCAQQKVEILKVLYRGADLLILDEPTAVLTPLEIQDLIATMKELAAQGKTVVIITHKLKEIKQSSEYCTIIRKGKIVDNVLVAEETKHSLAEKMVGRKVQFKIEKISKSSGKTVFEIKNLSVNSSRGIEVVKNLNLNIKSGEIFGLAGIEGNGQTELLEAIIGIRKCNSGTIKINNNEIQNTSVRNVIDHKISVIHEDRHKHGLILNFSVANNAILEKYRDKKFTNGAFLNYKERDKFTKNLIETYDIRPTKCINKKIRNLSGGNQQKLIIGREIANEPDLLIAEQPTRGLDVGAIEFVQKTLVKLRDAGKAILLISFELDEILNLSDRIGVIYDGKILKVLDSNEADEKKLGLLMIGGNEEND